MFFLHPFSPPSLLTYLSCSSPSPYVILHQLLALICFPNNALAFSCPPPASLPGPAPGRPPAPPPAPPPTPPPAPPPAVHSASAEFLCSKKSQYRHYCHNAENTYFITLERQYASIWTMSKWLFCTQQIVLHLTFVSPWILHYCTYNLLFASVQSPNRAIKVPLQSLKSQLNPAIAKFQQNLKQHIAIMHPN